MKFRGQIKKIRENAWEDKSRLITIIKNGNDYDLYIKNNIIHSCKSLLKAKEWVDTFIPDTEMYEKYNHYHMWLKQEEAEELYQFYKNK